MLVTSSDLRSHQHYLRFWVSYNCVIPLLYKVEAIKSIYFSTKVHNVRRFVGLVSYYRDIWRNHADTLAPLTKLCSTKVKLK